jgi:ankyrin repeat protein
MMSPNSNTQATGGDGLIILSWGASYFGMLTWAAVSFSVIWGGQALAIRDFFALFGPPLVSAAALVYVFARCKVTVGRLLAMIVPALLTLTEFVFALQLLGRVYEWDLLEKVKPESKDRAAIIEQRLAKGGDINAKDEAGWTLLHEAAYEGDIELVEMLLAKGVDVNVKSDAGLTALYYAVQGNNIATELLLAKGADVEVRNASGETVLHTAAEAGNTDVVQMLLAKGADVNAKDKHGFTPLHLAAARGSSGVAEALLANGAQVDAKDKNGWTALSYAVLNSNAAMVELLLSKGADVTVKDRDGETPMDLATDSKIRERLKQHAEKK